MTGSQIRRIRKRLAMTQVQLADLLGVAKNSVARWERDEMGIREPAARLLRILAAQHSKRKEK